MLSDNNLATLPTVSVLAPCRNEARFIRKAILSILQNDYPPNLVEVLVLDGMSTDGTREIVREICLDNPSVRLIDNPNMIVPTAMNIGIAKTKSDYIVRIDCHSEFPQDYISKCIEVSRRTGAANVGGYWRTLPGGNTRVARAIMLATSSSFGVGNSAFRVSGQVEKEADTVPFGTFPKSVFDQVGMYDERLVRNQDIELNSRIRKHGLKIVISPEIKLSYFNRATLRGIWQQSFNNGYWNPVTIWLSGSNLQIRHSVPLGFVISGLVLGLGSFFSKTFLAGFTAMMLLYLGFVLIGAIRAGARRQGTSIVLVIATFFILHFSYGLGSLWGLLNIPFKFPRRNQAGVGHAIGDRLE